MNAERARVADAARAAALFALDPFGLGGVLLRARPTPACALWIETLRRWRPELPLRRVPVHVAEDRLLGGLDLAATLAAGRPVAQRGLLAELNGGIALLPMAERLAPATVAQISAALDCAEVMVERDGMTARHPARIAVIAFDEGGDGEAAAAALRERLALAVELELRADELHAELAAYDGARIAAARAALPAVTGDDGQIAALCAAAQALGIGSLRAPWWAWRAAHAHAALAGRTRVREEDLIVAARLVLAPRACEPPQGATGEDTPPPPAGSSHAGSGADAGGAGAPDDLQQLLLQAARAALPERLLPRGAQAMRRRGGASGGRFGAACSGGARGRPQGARPGLPRGGLRLALVATLYAAAPWQRLRQRERGVAAPCGGRLDIRRDDLRVQRFVQRAPTTTVFVVDASGSTALQRLAEAKGAVELLLAECYVRRDRVALLAFRGAGATLLLPPTRSLVRAKRALAALPGGGATPLAAGLLAAQRLAEALLRGGDSVVLVLLTDGRANVTLAGASDRARAEQEAERAARGLRALASDAILIDTAPRPQAAAQRLAHALDARYLPLPYADAASLAQAVRRPNARPGVLSPKADL